MEIKLAFLVFEVLLQSMSFSHAGNEEDKKCWDSKTDAPLSKLVELPL